MISEEQLKKWASAPDSVEMARIKYTHEEIRKALSKYLPVEDIKTKFNLSNFQYDVYLQGSYANSTNISYDSDVDVVIELQSVFSYDLSNLAIDEKSEFSKVYPDSSLYTFEQFKKDVHEALNQYFGVEIVYDKKCLKIPKNTDRVNADVIPCFEHKKYERFTFYTRNKYIPGIKFYNTDTNEKIINYPKRHLNNCEAKNKDTEAKFKDTVRVFKNFNKKLKLKNILDDKTAPSYFIENMIYNCSAHTFNGSYTDIVLKNFQYWTNDIENGRFRHYICANEQDLLFNDNTWNIDDAVKFISSSINLFQEKI
ncbi:nucleotidyltransferase [bacterium]|nr:nucleotidyltransferase [bacterium]